MDAARHARMRGAPDSAAELTELALELVPRREHDARRAAARPRRAPLSRQRLRAVGRGARGVERRARRGRPTRARAPPARGDRLLAEGRVGGRRARGRGGAGRERSARAGPRHAAVAMYAGTVDLPKAAAAARAALDVLETTPAAEPELRRDRARRTRPSRPLPRRGLRRGGRWPRPRARGERRLPARRRHADGLQARPVAVATSTISTARGHAWPPPSRRRATRATSRRSPTSS